MHEIQNGSLAQLISGDELEIETPKELPDYSELFRKEYATKLKMLEAQKEMQTQHDRNYTDFSYWQYLEDKTTSANKTLQSYFDAPKTPKSFFGKQITKLKLFKLKFDCKKAAESFKKSSLEYRLAEIAYSNAKTEHERRRLLLHEALEEKDDKRAKNARSGIIA